MFKCHSEVIRCICDLTCVCDLRYMYLENGSPCGETHKNLGLMGKYSVHVYKVFLAGLSEVIRYICDFRQCCFPKMLGSRKKQTTLVSGISI